MYWILQKHPPQKLKLRNLFNITKERTLHKIIITHITFIFTKRSFFKQFKHMMHNLVLITLNWLFKTLGRYNRLLHYGGCRVPRSLSFFFLLRLTKSPPLHLFSLSRGSAPPLPSPSSFLFSSFSCFQVSTWICLFSFYFC